MPQDGLARTVYRAAPGPAHYYLQGCHQPLLVKIASLSQSGTARCDISLSFATIISA